jgi:hypothetical protein
MADFFYIKDRGKGSLHQRTGDRLGEERSRLRCAFVEGTQAFNTQTACEQCPGSVTFWYGFGSADPYHWLTDPDPDPALFLSAFQYINKKSFFTRIFAYYLRYRRYIYISLKG